MFRKILMIIKDFVKSSKRRELVEVYLVPLIFAFVLLFFYNKLDVNTNERYEFIKTFTDNILTIASLLAAFGVASITIILTSSSGNIEVAKKKTIKDRKDADNIPITYYKLVLIRNYYNIVVQFCLLFVSIIAKFIICNQILILILLIELWLLLHSIFLQVFVITTVYFLMWENKGRS
ncbi:hypothetical protein TthWC1_2579 [Thermoanaerobacter thermohydrosulfuricus WC1]|uniref:Uncharacterized protein n=2 Tax=Thermoanaerobacter TaxID=1754 RepID=D3T354_THEIA|nr:MULTISPECIES: hypothetical protein [Thermoanaerobacter]ADD02656.1 hypothetical protein Thit_1398 [Thermoanaerobacter italicus Ab9]EMT37952.1 hypothetical protein TthWC1_2579 [Thermoanaerobacter thermohydrosulfuricus WC1]